MGSPRDCYLLPECRAVFKGAGGRPCGGLHCWTCGGAAQRAGKVRCTQTSFHSGIFYLSSPFSFLMPHYPTLMHPFFVWCFHQLSPSPPQDLTWSWIMLGGTMSAGLWTCLSLGAAPSMSPSLHLSSRTLTGWASLMVWCRLLLRWPPRPSR